MSHDTPNPLAWLLSACPDMPDSVRERLVDWGIGSEAQARFGLAFSGTRPRELFRRLAQQIPGSVLAHSGLLHRRRDSQGKTHLRSALHAYHDAEVAYLLVPYRRDGRVVGLRALPFASRLGELQHQSLPASVMIPAALPGWFNADVLSQSRSLVVVRRELDAIAATTAGMPALACPDPAQITGAWIQQLAHHRVVFCLDDKACTSDTLATLRELLELHHAAAPYRLRPVPRRLRGRDLVDHLKHDPAVADPDRTHRVVWEEPEDWDEPQSDAGDTLLGALAVQKSNSVKARSATQAVASEQTFAGQPVDPGSLHMAPESGDHSGVAPVPPKSSEDQFVAALQLDSHTYLEVRHQATERGPSIVLRQWAQDAKARWQLGTRSVLNQDQVGQLIAALAAGFEGRALTERPEWMKP